MKVYCLMYDNSDGYTYNASDLIAVYSSEEAAIVGWDDKWSKEVNTMLGGISLMYPVNKYCGYRIEEYDVES